MAQKRKQTPKVNKPDWQRQLDQLHTLKLAAIMARDWAELARLQREDDRITDAVRFNKIA